MCKDFDVCPHCAAKGKHRLIRPATHRTPHVARSDGSSFHLYLEESYVRPAGSAFEVVALFRYDLDPAAVTGDSTLVLLPVSAADDSLRALQQAADRLASELAAGAILRRQYILGSDTGGPTIPNGQARFASGWSTK